MNLELSEADFDAYAPERTRATTMTAPRSALKRKLEVWLRDICERLAAEGIAFEFSATDEHPTARNGHRVDMQQAFLSRAKEARSAMEQVLGASAPHADLDHPEIGHARLEARVDASSVSLLIWLGGDARVDLAHAHAMLAHPTDDVLAAWDTLPETTVVEARASLSPRARLAIELSSHEVSTMAKLAIESDVPLVLGLRVAREEATKPRALDAWNDAALAFGKLLAAISWSTEGAIHVAARMSERPSRRGKRHVVKSAPVPEDRPSGNMKATIDHGSHVRALAGPFAGQAGVVQELDGKGGARVLFGLLAARVELRDLVIKGKDRGRPVLASSHRKPQS